MTIKWLIPIIILYFFFSSAWADSQLTRINTANSSSVIKMEFSITEAAPYHIFTLSHPDRLIIDFTNTSLSTNLELIKQEITSHYSEIKMIRSGHPNPSTLRIVLELKYPMLFKSFSKPRPTILLYKNHNKIPLIPSFLKEEVKTVKKPFVVVIDPGHGGKDPGTTGLYGSTEKNIVLAISKKLARLINQQPHTRAVLTRNHDYFIPLRTRLKLARKGKADLFIAIHADASEDKTSEGASIYALSWNGATKEAKHWLNNSGNYFELSGVDMSALEDKSSTLRSVLIDLAQTATMTDSMHLGETILTSMQQITALHYKRVVQAPFMVLKSPDIPSILIETGYLSNPSEEKKLRDPDYQNKMAETIFDGISLYIKKYAVAHT